MCYFPYKAAYLFWGLAVFIRGFFVVFVLEGGVLEGYTLDLPLFLLIVCGYLMLSYKGLVMEAMHLQ